MNTLDYINHLIEQGYSEEDAEKCADYMFSNEWDNDDDIEDVLDLTGENTLSL